MKISNTVDSICFEPTVATRATTVFETIPFNRSGTSPIYWLLDPCAGEGETASLMGNLLNCETWGCEPFPCRVEKAAARMDKCHNTAWESCSLTDSSVTILWCNPPYDDDRHGKEKRLELTFLKPTTPKLVRGGVLVDGCSLPAIIPQRILRYMARRDQRHPSLWLQWALSRPNSAFRDEIVAANHASVPVNVLEALAREMLENTTTEDPLETQVARTLLEASEANEGRSLTQSAAARQEKEALVKVPLMLWSQKTGHFGGIPLSLNGR